MASSEGDSDSSGYQDRLNRMHQLFYQGQSQNNEQEGGQQNENKGVFACFEQVK